MAKSMIKIIQEPSCWGRHAEVSYRLQCAALNFEAYRERGVGRLVRKKGK